MTEQEWLEYTNPQRMLDFLSGKVGDRKLRLFACACVRHIWNLLEDERSRRAVAVAEWFVDHLATPKELEDAFAAAMIAREAATQEASSDDVVFAADAAAQVAKAWEDCEATAQGAVWATGCSGAGSCRPGSSWGTLACQERRHQAALFRDIIGNPFHSITLDTSWKTPTVVQLAQSLYEERRFEDMPVLADALEEAGCQDAAVLGHCRGPGPHARGCWLLDLLLDKE